MEKKESWSIEFYVTARGESPAEEHIAALSDQDQARVYRYLDLLQQFGVGLGMPFARHIEGDLWELRPGPLRVFYFVFSGRRCIILNGYRKKANRAPRKEVTKALCYMADWREREG